MHLPVTLAAADVFCSNIPAFLVQMAALWQSFSTLGALLSPGDHV